MSRSEICFDDASIASVTLKTHVTDGTVSARQVGYDAKAGKQYETSGQNISGNFTRAHYGSHELP
jgi:hypothetical protein